MKIIKKKLANGLRFILISLPENLTVTTLVLVEAGSRYETKEISGLSHFLEHMCFKGTKKRPRAIDISHELDSLGTQHNAFTSKEITGYYVKSSKEHFKRTFEVVSDIYLNSVFDQKEIEKEKGVIIEEINMYEDLPQRKVGELFESLLYGDQPIGWSVAGNKEVVKKIKRDDFLQYHQKFYTPQRTTVIVSGNFDLKEAEKEIKNYFGNFPKAKIIEKNKLKNGSVKENILVNYKKTDQSHLVVGFKGLDLSHPDRYILEVISGILGQGMSSRLFEKLRNEMGVCYYVRASNFLYTDHGYFSVRAGVDNKRIKEVVNVFLAEFENLKNKTVTEKELEKVKEYIVGNLFLGLESSDSWAEFYGEQESLLGKTFPPKEIAQEIRKVGSQDIKRVAKKIFAKKNIKLALIGPVKDKNYFSGII